MTDIKNCIHNFDEDLKICLYCGYKEIRKMTKYEIEYTGFIEIEANNLEDLRKKFDDITNEQLGKFVYRVEALIDDNWEEI